MAAIDFPNSPTLNQEFTANGRTWIWTGTVWSAKVIDTSVSRYDVQDTAPTSPTNGDVWFNSTNARTYVYYDSAWVESNPALDGKSGVVAVASPLTNTGTDSSAVLGVDYSALQYGQNYVVNGDFDIWQRGTSFSVGSGFMYTADRWYCYRQSLSTGMTVSRQAAIATGSTFSARIQRDAGNTSTSQLWLEYNLESLNSANLAGKTVTISFSARAGANFSAAGNTLSLGLFTGTGTDQRISGGMTGAVSTIYPFTLTTNTQRFTATATIPTNATQVCFQIFYTPTGTAGTADFYEIDQVQLEVGAAATPFKRNAPSIQAELAACQRYYYRRTGGAYETFATGIAVNTVTARFFFQPPVTMRTGFTSFDWKANLAAYDDVGVSINPISSPALDSAGTGNFHSVQFNSSVTLTAGRFLRLIANNDATAYIGFSAEL